MRTGVFPEYLGDVTTEALLQNLVNKNCYVSSVNSIRSAYPNGFTVTAEIECPVADDILDEEILRAKVEASLRPGYSQPSKRLVRLILEPK